MTDTSTEMTHRDKSRKPVPAVRFVGTMIARLFFVAVFALVLAFVVVWLWNWLMPGLFGLSTITYWQAFGIMILARLVLGTIGPGPLGHRPYDRTRWGDRFAYHRYASGDIGHGKDFNGTMTWWHNYKRFWHDEGKAAFDAYMKKRSEGEPKGTTDKDRK